MFPSKIAGKCPYQNDRISKYKEETNPTYTDFISRLA